MEASYHDTFVAAVFMLLLMTVAIVFYHWLHHKKFNYLGESAVYMLTGLFVGILYFYGVAKGQEDLSGAIQMKSKFFYMVLLPPIIFEGGFTLRRMHFWKNFDGIFSLAFFGGLYSTAVTSGVVWLAAKITLPILDAATGENRALSIAECLVYGALISSTDPVTVLSLLPDNVDKRLYMLIFGESALNDAVAVILFSFFTNVSDPSFKPGAGTIVRAVFESAGVFVGSFLIGGVTAMVYAKLTKHLQGQERSILQVLMLYVFAYLSYLIAELSHMTGIISVFFAGVAMAHYAYHNLDEVAIVSIKVSLRAFSTMCEVFIFLYLGLGLVAFGPSKTTYNGGFIVLAFIGILISRSQVFVILGIKNMISKANRIPFRHQILIWFCGLRGAVAFALGVTFLESEIFSQEVKSLIFGTTILTVFLTVMVFGGLTPFMLKWLKIGEEGEEQEQEKQPITQGENGEKYVLQKNEDDDHAGQHEDDNLHHHVDGYMRKVFTLDKRYIKPFFSLPKKQLSFVVDPTTPKDIRAAPEFRRESLSSSGSLSESRRGTLAMTTVKTASVMEMTIAEEGTRAIDEQDLTAQHSK